VGDLQDGAKSEVLRRLKSVEGHVRGVAKMVEGGDVTYADVVQQTNAIFSAIRRINTVLLKDFVEERAEEEGASEEMVKDLVKAIERVVK
jgi:DNA-binding FrmR family transcriptional regulator